MLTKIAALILCVLMSVCFLTDPLPDTRVLALPETGTSERLIMNAMHDSLRSRTNIEPYREFYKEQEIPVDFCENYGAPHNHYKGTIHTGERCKVCGSTVYGGYVYPGTKCAYTGEILTQ